MLTRLRRILTGERVAPGSGRADARIAVAALLIEAAEMDRDFSSIERLAIEDGLRHWFGLSEEETRRLVASAGVERGDSHDLVRFTRPVKEAYSHEERVALMELIWRIVLADGSVDDYEANLMRRIAGLLYVSDQENGAARKRAAAARTEAGLDPGTKLG
ncbi:MAG: TerB family tellurite resistance protein [Alphaproteobacteria bacterium]|nr:TerB family tellurite resistance protein [Alphaproteobacteria bacterium]